MLNARKWKMVILCGLIPFVMSLGLMSIGTAESRKIVVWDYNDWADYIVPEFEARTGIELEKETLPQGRDAMLVRLVAGEVPDVIRVDKQDIGEFILKGFVADLTPYVERDDFPLQDIVGLENVLWQGKFIGTMPLANTNAINYNRSLFVQAGLQTPDELIKQDRWTYEVFLPLAKKLVVDKNGDGTADQYAYSSSIGYYASFFNWTWSNGGEAFNSETLEAQLTAPEVMEALEFYAELQQAGVMGKGRVENGTLAMGDGWVNPREDQPEIRFAVHPRGPKSGPDGYHMLLTSSPFVVYSKSSKKELAWEFIKFITSPDIQMRGVLKDSTVEYPKPLRISVLPDALEQARSAYPEYNWDTFYKAQQYYGRALPKIVNLRAIVRDISKEMQAVAAGEQPVANFVRRVNDRYTKMATGAIEP